MVPTPETTKSTPNSVGCFFINGIKCKKEEQTGIKLPLPWFGRLIRERNSTICPFVAKK